MASRPRAQSKARKSGKLPLKDTPLKTRIVSIPPKTTIEKYLKPTAPYVVLLLSPGPATVVRRVFSKEKQRPNVERLTFRNDKAIYIPGSPAGTYATIENPSPKMVTFGKLWPPDCPCLDLPKRVRKPVRRGRAAAG